MAHLIVTRTFNDGRVETQTHEWPGTATEACDARCGSLRAAGRVFTREGNTITLLAAHTAALAETGCASEVLTFEGSR